MFTIFYQYKFLTLAMVVFLLLSIICQIMMGVLFENMIQEAENMPTTENRLLKQCKLKYINSYRLNGKMCNTSVFVDKFLAKIQCMGISLSKLIHLSGQFMMLSVVVTGIAICRLLAAGNTLFQIIPFYLSSILGLYLYFSVSGIVDVSGKKELLKANLVDYLENHLMPRLELMDCDEKSTAGEASEQQKKEAEGKKSKTLEELLEEILLPEKVRKAEEDLQEASAEADYMEELEDLLKEFFA